MHPPATSRRIELRIDVSSFFAPLNFSVPPTRPRVLIAESHPVMADALQHLLTEVGHHTVEVVGTGLEAIEAAACWGPDLLITDVPLDGLVSGIEAAQQIWEPFGTKSIVLQQPV